MESISWSAKEYAPREKSADWYWVLGILSVSAAAASFLLGNPLFSVVLLLAGFTIGLASRMEPPTHTFTLTDEGLVIDEKLLPYEALVSFTALEYLDADLAPVLILKTRRILSPTLAVPLSGAPVDAVLSVFEARLPIHEHQESLIDRLMDVLRI